jgi:predicted nucleotidyltransferase
MAASSADTLIDRLSRAAQRELRRQPIVAAYAYGSRVSGAPRPDSDLDVGYYLDGHLRRESLSVKEEMQIAAALADAVGVPVDLRNLGTAPLEVRGRVLEQGRRIYSRDDVARVSLERDLLARYHDYKDELLAMHDARLQALARRGL